MSGRSQPLLLLWCGRHLLIHFSAAALAVVFAVALRGKVSPVGFGEFRRSAGRLWPGRTPLSPPLLRAVAVAVVAGEGLVTVVLAAALLFPAVPVLVGFIGAVALLVAFTVGHAVALRRGRTVACACFGRTSTTVGPVGLVRNGLLIAVGLAGLSAALPGGGVAPGWGMLALALAGAVGGLLLVSLEDLVGLFGTSTVGTRQAG